MNNYILKSILILLIGVLLFSTCEEPTEPDTTPPTVTILSPENDSVVFEITFITCLSTDNEGIKKLELYVDGISTGVEDKTEPYELEWNTTAYENDSYIITVRSYDVNDNKTDSDPITLIVDNSGSYPTPVELYPITYQDGSFTIVWSQNNDDDFSSYKLYESLLEDMGGKTLIFETTDKDDTDHVRTGINDFETRYYQVINEDIYGYQSTSNIESVYAFMIPGIILDAGAGYKILVLSNGNYLIAGRSSENEIILMNQDGNIIWSQSYGYEYAHTVQETPEGGLIVGLKGSGDVNLLKTDQDGNTIWIESFTGKYCNNDGTGIGNSVIQLSDGGYGLLIEVEDEDYPHGIVRLIKTNSNGGEEWHRDFIPGGYDGAYSILETDAVGLLITGYNGVSPNGYKIWLQKVDSNGNDEWNQLIQQSGWDRGYHTQKTIDGGFIICGITSMYTSGSTYDIWLVKTDSQGTVEWSKTFGDYNMWNYPSWVEQTTDGGYIIIGATEYNTVGRKDAWLIKTDALGNLEFSRTYGGAMDDIGYCVKQTTDGGYVITGRTDNEMWIFQTDSNGDPSDF